VFIFHVSKPFVILMLGRAGGQSMAKPCLIGVVTARTRSSQIKWQFFSELSLAFEVVALV
jgi:hypothetical protein